ncbi:MAG: CBS domain-containing protein [Emcibacter sp.]|nr:CBS domain-containing protein [Emcibacter sp.]
MNIEQNSTEDNGEPPSRDSKGPLQWLRSLFGGENTGRTLKDGLEEVISELVDEESSFGEEERSIIKNTLTFRNKRVDDIMVPRTDIVAVEASSSFQQVMDVFVAGTTSRLPVYRDTLDEVIAMVHIKDAFREIVTGQDSDKEKSLASIQRPLLFVPPSMKLFDLLTKMQSTHIHMALVVDEYGGTDGLLTIEDLVEQIVGDIEDEHDEAEEELLRELPGGDLMADARLEIEDLESLLGLDLLPDDQDDDVDTLGGLLFTLAGYIPEVGETIEDKNGLRYKIIEGDARSIKTVLIERGALPGSVRDNNQTLTS